MAVGATVGVLLGGAAVWWYTRRTLPARVDKMVSEAVHRVYPMPKRIILVRHGESVGNVNKSVFATVPDHSVPLTARGAAQAEETGRALKAIIGDDPIMFFISPYERTRGTFRGLLKGLSGNRIIKVREEPRCRELDFGNFQDPSAYADLMTIRDRFGKFFYRFPEGESGADVSDRVSSFFDSLFRSFRRPGFDPATNVIIVTHGFTLRVFLMRFFHWSVELFDRTTNPHNAAFVIMERCGPHGGLALTPDSARVIGLTAEQCVEADIIEDEERKSLGRADIHVPAMADSMLEPLPRDVAEALESTLNSPAPSGGGEEDGAAAMAGATTAMANVSRGAGEEVVRGGMTGGSPMHTSAPSPTLSAHPPLKHTPSTGQVLMRLAVERDVLRVNDHAASGGGAAASAHDSFLCPPLSPNLSSSSRDALDDFPELTPAPDIASATSATAPSSGRGSSARSTSPPSPK